MAVWGQRVLVSVESIIKRDISGDMLRVILDTNVMVSALRSIDGASNAILRDVVDRKLTLLMTPALFLEYEAVLKRPEQRIVHGLGLAELDRLLSALASVGEAVEISFQWRPQLPDPDDELVMEAAVNGRADALITHNLRDFSAAAPRFGLNVVTPRDWLKEMQQ